MIFYTLCSWIPHYVVAENPDMNFKKETGKRIREARANANGGRGITLDELSERTKHVLSSSRISNYEQGLRLPKPQDALILGQALGVSAGHLMCLEGEEDMLPEESDLLRNWRALPENERNAYARRIQALALVYRDAVPDEKVEHFSTKNVNKKRPSKA